MTKKIETAYWYAKSDHKELQEFNHPHRVQVLPSGSLAFYEGPLQLSLVIAPGDWHELTINWMESE